MHRGGAGLLSVFHLQLVDEMPYGIRCRDSTSCAHYVNVGLIAVVLLLRTVLRLHMSLDCAALHTTQICPMVQNRVPDVVQTKPDLRRAVLRHSPLSVRWRKVRIGACPIFLHPCIRAFFRPSLFPPPSSPSTPSTHAFLLPWSTSSDSQTNTTGKNVETKQNLRNSYL